MAGTISVSRLLRASRSMAQHLWLATRLQVVQLRDVTAAAGTTLNIGTGVKLGLPYKAMRCVYEIGNGVVAAAGTLQAPSLVDPATNVTTDPRGAYTTTTTMNGANIISAAFNMVNDVNTANNGGLHGLRQAAA